MNVLCRLLHQRINRRQNIKNKKHRSTNQIPPETVRSPKASLNAARYNPDVAELVPIRNFAVSSMRLRLSSVLCKIAQHNSVAHLSVGGK